MIFVTIVGILHHTDHVLRFDHSGWPFRAHINGINDITPFSYSLLVYPVIASWFIIKNKAYRVVTSTIAAVLVILAHTFVELPSHQYLTWADDSSPYGLLAGSQNLLHVHSPLLGVLSAVLGLILDVSLIILPILFWKERPGPIKGQSTPTKG